MMMTWDPSQYQILLHVFYGMLLMLSVSAGANEVRQPSHLLTLCSSDLTRDKGNFVWPLSIVTRDGVVQLFYVVRVTILHRDCPQTDVHWKCNVTKVSRH